MADSKLIRECDGTTGYSEYKDDFKNYAVLTDCEHVLERACPDPITEAIAAGEWGDATHPCDEDGDRHGTAAPRVSRPGSFEDFLGTEAPVSR